MAKSIKESYGPVQYHNSLTMLARESRNCGDNCQCDDCGCGQIDENKKAERLAKIARAAAAREKDQSKEKEKATAKHNKASAKSREAIKYRGNKDQFGRVREDIEITESDKAEYDKLMKQYGDMPASKIPPKIYMRISQLGRKVRGDKGGPKVGDLLKSMKKRKMGEEVDQVEEATNKFPKWWEDTPKNVLTKVYHAKRQLPPKLDKKSWQKIVNALHDKRPAPLADYRKWSTMDPAKIQYNKESVGKVIGEDSIKVNGGSAVEIGKNERGSKTQYYWKDKSGLKNVFDTPQKLRYSLRNDANFSGAEKAVKQLLGEAKMGKIRKEVAKGTGPWTTIAIVNHKVVEQERSETPDHVPAVVRELKRRHPLAKISVEDKGGSVMYSESSVDEGGLGGGRSRYGRMGARGQTDDEGYRKDGSNPVDDAIAKRNAARRKEAVRKAQAGDKTKKGK